MGAEQYGAGRALAVLHPMPPHVNMLIQLPLKEGKQLFAVCKHEQEVESKEITPWGWAGLGGTRVSSIGAPGEVWRRMLSTVDMLPVSSLWQGGNEWRERRGAWERIPVSPV